MHVENGMDYPGAEIEDDAHSTQVFLAEQDEWMEQLLEDNLHRLGIVHVLERSPWRLILQGDYCASDVSNMAVGRPPVVRRTVEIRQIETVEVPKKYL